MDTKNLLPGKEQHEHYYSYAMRKNLVQYDYRATDGALFSTIAKTLEKAREKRDIWLREHEREKNHTHMTVPLT